MPIRFFCHNCQQVLKAREDKIGRRMPCPKCKKAVVVPEANDPRLEATAAEPEETESAEDPFGDLIVYDRELVYETEEQQKKRQRKKDGDDFDRRLVSITRPVIYGQAVLLVSVAVAAVLAGYLIGSTNREKITAESLAPQRVIVDGMVQWEGVTGLLADRGAVILALPADLAIEKKVAGDRLSPERTMPPKDDLSLRTIEDWGGQYTRTNDIGEFQLFLIPGEYQVLIVSHQSKRGPRDRLDREDLAAIGQYVTLPHELIGQARYVWRVQAFDEDSHLFHDFKLED